MTLERAAVYQDDFATTFAVLTPEQGLGQQADEDIRELAAHRIVAVVGLFRERLPEVGLIAASRRVADLGDQDRYGSEDVALERMREKPRVFVGFYDIAGTESVEPSALVAVSADDAKLVAYAFGGPKTSDTLPADFEDPVTLAVRVGNKGSQLVKERSGPGERYRIGPAAMRILMAVLISQAGVRPEQFWLKTLGSNTVAVELYEQQLGFVRVGEPVPVERVSTGFIRYMPEGSRDVLPGVNASVRRVPDTEITMVLGAVGAAVFADIAPAE